MEMHLICRLIIIQRIYSKNKQYYIGYINNTTVSAMNGARWISDGNSTPSAIGRFSLASTLAPNNPGWSDANSIVINDTPIIYTPNASNPAPQPSDFTNWIQSIRENFIITIRQRGNPNNFGIYRVNSAWSPLPVGAQYSYFAGLTYITSNNEGAPWPPTTTPPTPPGFMIGDHPLTGVSNGNGINGPAFPLEIEFEISYAPAGEAGPRGEQGERGTQGERGEQGPAGPGLNGAVGVSFSSAELFGQPTRWSNSKGSPLGSNRLQLWSPISLYSLHRTRYILLAVIIAGKNHSYKSILNFYS